MKNIIEDSQNKELRQLGDLCIHCWECMKLAEAYCDTEEIIGWHVLDDHFVRIIKEYSLLQVAKLHDNPSIGKFNNHSIIYVINNLPDNKIPLDKYKSFCKRKKLPKI